MTYFAFAKYDIPDGDAISKWNQRFQIIHEVGSLPGIVLGSILMQRHRLLPFYGVTFFLALAVAVQMI
jgi:MFS family permease